MDYDKEPCLRCQRPWANQTIHITAVDHQEIRRDMGDEKIEVGSCPLNEEEVAVVQKAGSCAARSPIENLTLRYQIVEIRGVKGK